MSGLREKIGRNLESVLQRIEQAAQRAGRSAQDVRLVAVTKTVGIEEVRILCEMGVTDLGENRLEVAAPKIENFEGEAIWHMIGSIQRRKARDVAALFDRADSIDRLELAEALNRRCEALGKRLPVLLEVNVSGETQKHGFRPEELGSTLEAMAALEHLDVQGTMTMAPFVADPELTRPVFASLRELTEKAGLTELSMGMTNDFEVAVEEGATQVRIGTALFE
ncbi:MAG: YggS family pyridoxal phosphate-dependent enzyme [Nitrospiraceae bacterium]|nr:YggS family pyridoxal phosphate-dependent enzyme [Nitrospiraceae bacterium]